MKRSNTRRLFWKSLGKFRHREYYYWYVVLRKVACLFCTGSVCLFCLACRRPIGAFVHLKFAGMPPPPLLLGCCLVPLLLFSAVRRPGGACFFVLGWFGIDFFGLISVW